MEDYINASRPVFHSAVNTINQEKYFLDEMGIRIGNKKEKREKKIIINIFMCKKKKNNGIKTI